MAEVLYLTEGETFGLRIPTARADMKAIHARKQKIIAELPITASARWKPASSICSAPRPGS
jgi:hypothetical protein